MIYFFHHYELPVIIQQAQVQQILRLRARQRHQQQTGVPSGNAHNNGPNQPANDNNGPANDTNGGNNNNNNNPNNNNNNNGTRNANRNVVIHLGNFFNQHMTATLIVSRALNVIGAVRNVIANDIFGVAAIFNNNNDNNLNNNNNNPHHHGLGAGPMSHIRINLANLRRINLSSIQINPVASTDNGGAGDGVDDGDDIGSVVDETGNNEHSDGNEIDGDVQFDLDTESTDECDNLLKKHVHRQETETELQHDNDDSDDKQLKILDLNEIVGDGITIAADTVEMPKAPVDVLIANEIQTLNCHGDPDRISDDTHRCNDEPLHSNNVMAASNEINENQRKSIDDVVDNRNESAVARNPNDECPCVVAKTTIGELDSIGDAVDDGNEECNSDSNGTGDMTNEYGNSRCCCSRRTVCGRCKCNERTHSDGNDGRNDNGNEAIDNNSSDSTNGNRLPIVGPFE